MDEVRARRPVGHTAARRGARFGGRSVTRPRVWAFLLTPVFWGAVPIFALGVATPAISATWVALLFYAHRLVLPPPRRRSEP